MARQRKQSASSDESRLAVLRSRHPELADKVVEGELTSDHLIVQRLRPARQPVQIIEQDVDDVLFVFLSLAASVWRQYHVVEGPERRIRRERFFHRHIDASAGNCVAAQGVDQRRLIDAAASRNIDQMG